MAECLYGYMSICLYVYIPMTDMDMDIRTWTKHLKLQKVYNEKT
jgi:hypothetical protein